MIFVAEYTKPEIETIKSILKDNWFKEDGDNYYYTIDADYRDKLGMEDIKDIAERGRVAFDEALFESTRGVEDYYYSDLISEIEKELERDISDEEREWVNEHVHWQYEEEHFLEQDVDINILVASDGCRNTDFVCDNILNYYSEIGYSNGYKDGIPKESCLLWLARQFKMVGKFRAAVKAERNSDDEISYKDGFTNKFINSCMQELYNLPSHMSCLCFLVSMTVRQLIEWHDNKETIKGITVPKTTMCGLFDPWSGGGSLLDVDLPKELTIPKDMIWDCSIDGAKSHGYDVGDVYGLIGSCWNSEIKLEKD